MFDVAINPVLVQLGPLAIRYYGLVYALGFLFTYWYLRQQIKHHRLKLTYDALDTFIIYMIIAVIVGGRVGEFLFYQFDVLISNPLQLFKIWQGGMSFHGGVIGVAIALWLFCKKYKIHFYEITDHIVIPASLILFFGRIANFINQELVGTVTNVSWAVNFNGEMNELGEKVYRHPSQLYEALKNLTMFIVLFSLDQEQKTKRKFKRGFLSWLFIFMYGVLRTVANIWRDDPRWFLGIFGTGQVLSIVMALIAGFVLLKYYCCNNKNNERKARRKKRKKK